MHASFHRTVEAAVQAAADPLAFERVAYYALREQFPELELTAPSKDDGKDLQVRRLGSTREDVRVMVSLQKNWTSKLDAELDTIAGLNEGERPRVAVFVTNADPQEASISKRRERALDIGVGLQVVGRTGLAVNLNEPDLRWVAEFWLGLEPLRPRLLQSTTQFVKATGRLVPGFNAALIGRGDTIERIRELLWADGPQAPRILVIEGAGGLGKTRLAVEAASRDLTTMVAPGTVPLPPEEIKDLPANERAVLIVDDAHRCPDLSGVTALMRDDRFDLTKLVFTIRPGMLDRVLVNANLEFVEREVIPLRNR